MNNSSTYFEYENLKEDFRQNKCMVLYLGAGVNSKNMHWKDILEYLFSYSGLNNEEIKAINNLQNDLKAAILKNKLGDEYIPIIQHFLYSKGSREKMRKECDKYLSWKKSVNKEEPEMKFFTLFVLADMVINHQNIRAVVTQNYDNFLTQAILLLQENLPKEQLRRIPIDIYDGWNDSPHCHDTLPIYHVHGYIAPSWEIKPKDESKHIVLSQDESYDMQREVFSWQTASQLYFFTHYTTIILGLSLEDMTTLRLVTWSNPEKSGEKIYFLTAETDKQISEGQEQSYFYLKQEYYDKVGLHTIYERNGYYHLLEKLYNISINNKTT